MEPGQGQGIDEHLFLFSPVNFDAADTGSNPIVTEVWYEQYMFDGQLKITGGKLYVPNYMDNNEYANDETAQFLGSMFRNSPIVEWSEDNGLGLRMKIAPKGFDFAELEFLWMEQNVDWQEIFDQPFFAGQVNNILTLSPDLQLVWNPGDVDNSKKDDEDVILVYGMRGQVGF